MKISSVAWFTIALSAFPSVRLAAQDVVVGDPVWASTDPAPDEMPKAKGRLRPEFPDEMRKASEVGYVIVDRFVDAGEAAKSLSAFGTEKPYQRAVEEAFRDWQLSPGKRGGKPVDTRVWVPVIFNLKSAAVKGPDATPRLLSVTPVFTRERPTPGSQPPIVRMKLHLDTAGAIAGMEPEGETQLKARTIGEITTAVNAWHFAPARKDGQPVAADIVVPVLCQQPIKPSSSKVVQPRPLFQTPPQYPMAMRRFGLGGQVLIDFEVDTEGKVVNPVVAESDNPAFDEPALDALFKWKFQPATRDGKPEKAHLRVPIVFTLDWGPNEKGIVRIEKDADQSKLPPELRFDTPPKFRGVMLPVYPFEARQAGAKGKASVAILINPQGRVGHVSVISADRPEFGLALMAAVEGYRFDPAYRDGKPVSHLLKFEQEFNYSALADEEGDRLMALEKNHPERIFGADKLDAPPTPRSRRSPVFPLEVAPDVLSGEALIEFLIDTDGHARLPRVVSASDPAFGYAGVQSVGTWLFTPPMANGKAVVARVRVPLKFGAKPAKAPAAAKPAAEDSKPAK